MEQKFSPAPLSLHEKNMRGDKEVAEESLVALDPDKVREAMEGRYRFIRG